MIVAAVDTFGYRLLFLLHIVSIVVAFAPGWVIPGLRRKVDQRSLAGAAGANDMRLHGPALVLAGLFGLGMVGVSDKVYEFSQAWVSVALLLWFIMLGLVFGLLIPAYKKVAAGDESAVKLSAMAGGLLHLLFLIMAIDMIWKPGL